MNENTYFEALFATDIGVTLKGSYCLKISCYFGSLPLAVHESSGSVQLSEINTLLLDCYALAMVFRHIPEKAHVRLYFSDKRLGSVVWGSPFVAEKHNIPEDIRSLLKKSARRKKIQLDLLSYSETDAMNYLSKKVISLSSSETEEKPVLIEQAFEELKETIDCPISWFMPKTMLF